MKGIFSILIRKNTIKIQKFYYLNKIWDIRKKSSNKKILASMTSTNSQQDNFRQDAYFVLILNTENKKSIF